MASYSVLWRASALRAIRKLESREADRIHSAVSELADNPYPEGAEKLKSRERTFRVRAGGYRIIYSVEDREKQVHILKVGHRRDVYRR
jgi:mRNA interferase RelE/StbE